MHQDRHALPLRQRHHLLADRRHPLTAQQAGLRARGLVGDVRRRPGLGIRLVQVDGRGGALVARVAGVVHAQVGRDPVEPSAEARLGAVGGTRPVDAQEDLLRQLFRHRLVVHHPEHEVDDRLAVLLHQHIEGRHVAGAERQHDLGVFHPREVAAHARRGVLHGLVVQLRVVDRERSHVLCNPIF